MNLVISIASRTEKELDAKLKFEYWITYC